MEREKDVGKGLGETVDKIGGHIYEVGAFFLYMDPNIRQATLADLDTLEHFQHQLVQFERPFDPTIPKNGTVGYYNLKKLLGDTTVQVLVAEVDSTVVGCGFGQIRKDNEWSVQEQIGYIGLMFIHKKYRGNQIGKLIVEALIQWFKEKNISDIRLKVYEKNISAVKAYRNYGFQDFIIEMRRGPI